MLLDILSRKSIIYIFLGVLGALSVLVGSVLWLLSDRDGLVSEIETARSSLRQSLVSNQESQIALEKLSAELRFRNQEAERRILSEKERSKRLANVTDRLREELRNARCSGDDYLWPDSVFERMRRNTVSDKNKSHSSERSHRVPDYPRNTGAKPKN